MATQQSRAGKRFPWLLLILLIGLGLRIWYLRAIADAPDFEALRQDLDVQDYQARAMISGDWRLRPEVSDPCIPDTPYYRPPGYPFFLAAQYYLFSASYWTPRIVQLFLGLATIVLMYMLGCRCFNRGVGLLTAFFTATYWSFLYFEGEVNDPAIFVFLLPCLFLLLWRWRRYRRVRDVLAVGLLTGAYALMRPNILIYGPVMACWMAWRLFRLKEGKKIAAHWMVLALSTALMIAPVTLRNWVVSGDFVPISTYFGENLLIGNGPDSDGYTSWLPYLQELEGSGRFSVWEYDHIVKGLGKEIGRPDLSHAEASSIFMHKALDYIRAHPKRTLRLALKKALLFWSPIEITGNKVIQCEKDHYPPLKYLPGFPLVAGLFFFGLGVVIYDAIRKRLPNAELLFLILSFCLLYYASFMPFFVNSRARHPLTGCFLLIGAYGLWRLYALWTARRRWQALAGGALIGLLFLAAARPIIPYTPDRARWHYGRAESYLRSGRIAEARAESERLLSLPDPPSLYMPFRLGHAFAREGEHAIAVPLLRAALGPEEAAEHPRYREDLYYHIGRELGLQGKTAEAIDAYEAALALDPEDARVLNNLGVIEDRRGAAEKAEAFFRKAVVAAPDFALAHGNLADLLVRKQAYDTAIGHFQQALAITPEDANLQYNLARCLDLAGRQAAALNAYKHALELNPKDPRIHNNLALLAQKAGDFDRAEAGFKAALAVDSDFTLAWINWAAMHQENGNVEAAVAIYEQALATHPDDAGLYNGLGYLYASQEKSALAREAYEEALRIAPRYALALNNYGNLLLEAGETEAARALYERAAKADKADYRAWFNLGRAWEKAGDSSRALQAYEAALERAPKLVEAHFNMANLWAGIGNIEEAMQGYAQVISLAPDHSQAHCNYGLLLAVSGKSSEARQHLEKALELDPHLTQAAAILQRLQAAAQNP